MSDGDIHGTQVVANHNVMSQGLQTDSLATHYDDFWDFNPLIDDVLSDFTLSLASSSFDSSSFNHSICYGYPNVNKPPILRQSEVHNLFPLFQSHLSPCEAGGSATFIRQTQGTCQSAIVTLNNI